MELAVLTEYTAHDLARAESPRQLLIGGSMTARVSAAGTGVVTFDGLDLTRWRGDAVEDADGLAVYLRDLDSGRVWTVGWRPGQGEERYQARFGAGTVEIVRQDDGLEARLCLAVAPAGAFVGHLRLSSLDGRTRRVEVTTAAEVVLHDRQADASHPAFSKLFIQTEAEGSTLLARRRQRSPEDRPAWLAHWFDDGADDVSLETDRLTFAGRGRDRRQPAALDKAGALGGTTGAVLDPVVALRTAVTVEPDQPAVRAFGLAGGRSRDAVLDLADRLATVEAVEGAIQDAAQGDGAEPDETEAPAPLAVAPEADRPTGTLDLDDGALRQFNGIGGFSQDGTEYVMHLRPGADGRPALPPLPWTNVIANEHGGYVVSERGSASTWSANSRENRLTPWSNDPAEDPGEALYVQDADSGAFWSPTPGPAPAHAPYEVRHGFGYSTWRTVVDGVEHHTTQSLAPDAAARLTVVRLTNASGRRRQLAVTAAARLDLGASNAAREIRTERDGEVLFARNALRGEFSDRVAVARAVAPDGGVSLTADRAAFTGRFGAASAPLAVVTDGALDGATGDGLDFAAHRVQVTLEPGESKAVAFVLGEAASQSDAQALAERFDSLDAIQDAVAATREFWRETTQAIQIETPEPALDLVVNGWLVYQNLSCRMWGRTAFYQSGGAFGFRDQLQDASALVYARPDLTRAQVLRNAAHQFEAGDVLHWWHPPLPKGIRTRFADDLLWLPLLASDYAATTGDDRVFDEDVRFLTARALAEGEDELFLEPQDAGTSASVYEHCARAIDRSLAVGEHGLPLMGVGDWNDGMNRVGREGRGESVWMGFFLAATLDAFLPHVLARDDADRADRYRQHRAHLQSALNADGWDGGWYRRAFYDSGAVLGSAQSDECQIDALVQAWSVLTGVAPPDRARQSLDALEARLVDEDGGLIRLLDPPFDVTPHDPGYIKGYLPGVRENGGQYTHAALWAVRAMAQAGRCERAAPLLAMLSPVSHTSSPEAVATYQTEPYVVAADVYGVAPHVGRGGWTWYTGSAGWMWRVAVESVLGFGIDRGRAITLDPCVPASWPGFSLRYRLPDGSGTEYAIRMERGDAPSLTLDGAGLPAGDWRVPLVSDGATHEVVLTLPGASLDA